MRNNCLLLLIVSVLCMATLAPARDANGNIVSPASSQCLLSTFTYTVTSSRDGNTYTGVMVGQDPHASTLSPTNVSTPVIPLIITTNTVAMGLTSGWDPDHDYRNYNLQSDESRFCLPEGTQQRTANAVPAIADFSTVQLQLWSHFSGQHPIR